MAIIGHKVEAVAGIAEVVAAVARAGCGSKPEDEEKSVESEVAPNEPREGFEGGVGSCGENEVDEADQGYYGLVVRLGVDMKRSVGNRHTTARLKPSLPGTLHPILLKSEELLAVIPRTTSVITIAAMRRNQSHRNERGDVWSEV